MAGAVWGVDPMGRLEAGYGGGLDFNTSVSGTAVAVCQIRMKRRLRQPSGLLIVYTQKGSPSRRARSSAPARYSCLDRKPSLIVGIATNCFAARKVFGEFIRSIGEWGLNCRWSIEFVTIRELFKPRHELGAVDQAAPTLVTESRIRLVDGISFRCNESPVTDKE